MIMIIITMNDNDNDDEIDWPILLSMIELVVIDTIWVPYSYFFLFSFIHFYIEWQIHHFININSLLYVSPHMFFSIIFFLSACVHFSLWQNSFHLFSFSIIIITLLLLLLHTNIHFIQKRDREKKSLHLN